MSHELRTPLNAILGFSQLLANEALPATAEQKKKFTQNILTAGQHLLTLINEILDLAKIESGTLALSMEPVALDEIIQESRAMTEALGEQRGIRMLFPPKLDLHVLADRTRLKQIILNLISNAIKYNRDMGMIIIDASMAGPGRARISVRDTGSGLTPEQLAALFQPFNRLGQEGGTEEGTGSAWWHLLSARNGVDGIELAREHLPHVILMDMNLPGISGTEAQRILRDDPETAAIPVIALTANAMPRDIKAGMEAGFFRYITKPLNIDELIEAIDCALALTGREEQ